MMKQKGKYFLLAAAAAEGEALLALLNVAATLAARDLGDAVEGGAVDASLAGAAAAGLEVVHDVEALVAGLVVVGAEEAADLAHALVGLAEGEAAAGNDVVDGDTRGADLHREVDTDVAAHRPALGRGGALDTTAEGLLADFSADGSGLTKHTRARRVAEIMLAERPKKERGCVTYARIQLRAALVYAFA